MLLKLLIFIWTVLQRRTQPLRRDDKLFTQKTKISYRNTGTVYTIDTGEHYLIVWSIGQQPALTLPIQTAEPFVWRQLIYLVTNVLSRINTYRNQNGTVLTRAHTCAKAADSEKLLLLNKGWIKHRQCRGIRLDPHLQIRGPILETS